MPLITTPSFNPPDIPDFPMGLPNPFCNGTRSFNDTTYWTGTTNAYYTVGETYPYWYIDPGYFRLTYKTASGGMPPDKGLDLTWRIFDELTGADFDVTSYRTNGDNRTFTVPAASAAANTDNTSLALNENGDPPTGAGGTTFTVDYIEGTATVRFAIRCITYRNQA